MQIKNSKSSIRQLSNGVRQDLVLGPLLYVLNTGTAPIADIIKSYNLQYHLYADDTQIYVSFSSRSYIYLHISYHIISYHISLFTLGFLE